MAGANAASLAWVLPLIAFRVENLLDANLLVGPLPFREMAFEALHKTSKQDACQGFLFWQTFDANGCGHRSKLAWGCNLG